MQELSLKKISNVGHQKISISTSRTNAHVEHVSLIHVNLCLSENASDKRTSISTKLSTSHNSVGPRILRKKLQAIWRTPPCCLATEKSWYPFSLFCARLSTYVYVLLCLLCLSLVFTGDASTSANTGNNSYFTVKKALTHKHKNPNFSFFLC